MNYPQPSKCATLVLASSVKREAVDWLWPGRVARRSVSLLVGDPGLGKSLLTCALAAELSRSGTFAVIATAEDSLSATARPRLEAAQADLDKVAFVEMQADDGLPAGLYLPDDLDGLESRVEEVSAGLLIVDPLMAHLPAEVNSWRDQSVRLALAPLHALAERQGCSVLVVAHLNKALSAEPLRRIGGSVGIPGAARSVLLLARDPDNEARRVLAHVQCNVAPLAASLLYELDPVLLPASNGDPDVETVRLVECGESDPVGADLLGVERGNATEKSAVDEAMEFLRVELAEGPRSVREVQREARDAGISPRTLDRAKQRLRVTSERQGGIGAEGAWFWSLPGGSLSTPAVEACIEDREAGVLSQNGSTVRDSADRRPLSAPSTSYDALRPLPGDEGFPELVLAPAAKAGQLTTAELAERMTLHERVKAARTPAA
jgi:hypothetical protein